MADYRWNQLDNARGYDATAQLVHPYYLAIQDVLLEQLALLFENRGTQQPATVLDVGGGSGRLGERILERFPNTLVWVVDQSESFLTLARDRLQRFGTRAVCQQARLQDAWSTLLDGPPLAIVSMSAIHHLDPGEKQQLYQQCASCLAPGGLLLNGDEVRPEDDALYLAHCREWAQHMHEQMDQGLIPEPLHDALLSWEVRNVEQFSEPRVSGQDCHETAATQLAYYTQAGLSDAEAVWTERMWSVLRGRKTPTSSRS